MNEVDFSKVGLKMKQLRSERGITQEQVAKDLKNCDELRVFALFFVGKALTLLGIW